MTNIETTMPGKTLVILGSGPGIGVAVARTFAVRGFTQVALVSRNKDRLAEDQDQVLTAIQERGYSCQVKTWVCDIANLDQLKDTLKDIGGFGTLECVLFNAARVAFGPPLEESTEAIEQDFRVSISVLILISWTDMFPKAHEPGSLRNCKVGDTTAQASTRRQYSIAHRHIYHTAVQRADTRSRLAFNGQISSESTGLVDERQTRTGCAHWST